MENQRPGKWRSTCWSLAYVSGMTCLAAAASYWMCHGSGHTCEMDGQPLTPELRADLQTGDGRWHAFCSIRCARNWQAQKPDRKVTAAIVRDALTGKPIDAYVAFFVRSNVVTNSANGNHTQSFQYRSDAWNHIQRFGGELVDDPFESP